MFDQRRPTDLPTNEQDAEPILIEENQLGVEQKLITLNLSTIGIKDLRKKKPRDDQEGELKQATGTESSQNGLLPEAMATGLSFICVDEAIERDLVRR